jgi:hypothetical protein
MKFGKKIFFVMILTMFLLSSNVYAINITQTKTETEIILDEIDIKDLTKNDDQTEDIDPTVDLKISVKIKEIRAFDKIDLFSDPDFYVKVIINDAEEITSDIWHNQIHVTDEWSTPFVDVPDDKEWINVTIQLWDSDPTIDKLCDIAFNSNSNPIDRTINVNYNLKTGHWFGDDMLAPTNSWFVDYSGYGRANGCDDNSIYEQDLDCELWFDILQNDLDGDGLPYWTETEVFETNPAVDDRGRDDDCDGVPIEWEYKWGHRVGYDHHNETYIFYWAYHPFEYNDHKNIDLDGDSINNYEEYLTSRWGSDPHRKDIFVELDQMQAGPNGEIASILPNGSKELLYKAFNRQNIVFHLDDGSWEDSGSDMIPFDDETNASWDNQNNELNQIYQEYFVNSSNYSWRRGVFHYGVVIYQSSVVNGNAFGSNRYQISAKGMEEKAKLPFPLTGNRDIVYASAYMHELGHSLDLEWLLGHVEGAYHPWQPLWWFCRPYKSVMNYGYMYGSIWNLVDYSDGSRGIMDHDDWSNIDYSYFEQF